MTSNTNIKKLIIKNSGTVGGPRHETQQPPYHAIVTPLKTKRSIHTIQIDGQTDDGRKLVA